MGVTCGFLALADLLPLLFSAPQFPVSSRPFWHESGRARGLCRALSFVRRVVRAWDRLMGATLPPIGRRAQRVRRATRCESLCSTTLGRHAHPWCAP